MTTRTDRLRLEPLAESHAAAMLPLLDDERLYQYIPDTHPRSLEALAARYRRQAAGSPSPREIWWNFILFLGDSSVPVGYVQATLVPAERVAEVGYVLSSAHRGQGYATEALGWLMAELGRRGDIDRVSAQIDTRNAASIAVVRRLEFVHVATRVEDTSTDHVFERSLADLAPGRRPT
ncbi:MAG: GNAT family N-acetyltransferase [Pseudomonadota bacterium]|nr:GNAT family N-acetyltransferase [Pseudomonadota bacterium]